MMISKIWEEQGNRKPVFKEYRVSVCKMERILWMDGSDGSITV